MRKKLVVGNWKMNMLTAPALDFVAKVAAGLCGEACVCAPFTVLSDMSKAASGSKLRIGAQNMYFKESGAYTGEVSPAMLRDIGVEYVILGHSERRMYFGETDADICSKVRTALDSGIAPILCCGESAGRENPADFVKSQISAALSGVRAEELGKVIIAYEPIWAIGTGKTATPDVAQNMIHILRESLRVSHGNAADDVLFLYGGSVNSENISDFLKCEDIDGALVGGASLDAQNFLDMAAAAERMNF